MKGLLEIIDVSDTYLNLRYLASVFLKFLILSHFAACIWH